MKGKDKSGDEVYVLIPSSSSTIYVYPVGAGITKEEAQAIAQEKAKANALQKRQNELKALEDQKIAKQRIKCRIEVGVSLETLICSRWGRSWYY